jgi:hypothetical protein
MGADLAKEFHDQVLLLGNAPLHVLEDHIDAWIAEEKKRVNAGVLTLASWTTILCALLLPLITT